MKKNYLTGKDQKAELFKELSNYTSKNYTQELGNLSELFPPGVRITDWQTLSEQYTQETGIKPREVGTKVEFALIQYVKNRGIEVESRKGRGEDIIAAGRVIEVKSSKSNNIQANLQTTAFKADRNKFYMFVTGTDTSTIEITTISSYLLYEFSLGREFIEELEKGSSKKLRDTLRAGIKDLDIENLIYNTLTRGREDKITKSFKIGNGIRVRFKIEYQYEPPIESRPGK